MKKEDLTLRQCWSFLAVLLLVLFVGCGYFQLNSQVLLLVCTLLAAAFARWKGYSVREIETMAVNGIRTIVIALIINICIGMLISVWISAGTFSLFIQLCLKIVNPRFLLVETFVFCCIFSALIGSCWICAGTVGLSLFYLADMVEINPYLLLGAIVGGSRFGACISPISDSANVSVLLSGVQNIYEHIRAMLRIVLPSALLTGIVYACIDFAVGASRGTLNDTTLEENLEQLFGDNMLALLPALVLCLMIYRRKTTLSCLLASIMTGALVTIVIQEKSVYEVANILYYGYGSSFSSEDPLLNNLFARGGIASMAGVIFTLIIGMSLSGILGQLGVLKIIVNKLAGQVKSPREIVLISMLMSILGYGATGDSQPSKVLVSDAFSNLYRQKGLKKGVLSRSLELSAFGEGMFPWSVGAAYFLGLFQIQVGQYWYFILFYYITMAANVLLLFPKDME